MYRTFTLRNEKGQEYPLSSPDFQRYGFLTEPDGLGIDIKNAYVKLGETFLRTESDIQQGEFEGTMLFPSYPVYREFANFIFTSETLTLLYEYEGSNGVYHRRCDFASVEKGEMNEYGVLECKVEFDLNTLYYFDEPIDYYVIASETDRRYTIPYPNRYVDFNALSLVIDNDGHIPASFACTIWGYIEYPTIIISDVDDNELYNIRLPKILQQGERIEYSSRDGEARIQFIDSNGTVTNLLPSLSILNNNFVRFPIGQYKLSFSGDTAVTNQITYAVYKYYKAV